MSTKTVLGNDPKTVAETFQQLLAGPFRSAFAEVVFAVLPGPNLDAFDHVLGRVLKQ